ncbi:MAG: DUF4124 domain-containing protein [Arenicellales bacterium]|nr:DUF4124 domain-containing protein [Arenicellales bacterium]
MHYAFYLTMFLAFAAHAQTIYKYLDDQGNVIYSEEPPTGRKVKVIEVPPEPNKEETKASEEGQGKPEKSPAMDRDKREPKKDQPETGGSEEISKFELGQTITIAFMSRSCC